MMVIFWLLWFSVIGNMVLMFLIFIVLFEFSLVILLLNIGGCWMMVIVMFGSCMFML